MENTVNERIEGGTYGMDSKDRVVGGYAVIRAERRSCGGCYGQPGADEHGVIYGDWFLAVRIFSTRNGERFGAHPPATRFAVTDLDGARAHATKALTAQAKRYAKKFAEVR